MKHLWFAVGCVTLAVGLAPIAAAQGRGHEKAKNGKSEAKEHAKTEKHDAKDEKHADRRVNEPAVVIDRDGHRRIVTQYYSRESLPPGLAKRESLPPGLQKQLRERGHLPPGLQKRLVAVPAPLASQLPGLPPHYTRYFAGRDLIVVDTRTNEVVALIQNVIVLRR